MPNSQGYNVSQSAWAIDAVESFETSPIYTAGTAQLGAAGELQNDYTIVHGGKRFANAYALSCSNYGIQWDPAEPPINAPTFASGTGVQIGYDNPTSTSSLPPATYKLGTDWDSEIQPRSNGFTLSIWMNTKAVPGSLFPTDPPPSAPPTQQWPFVADWPLFHFGRELYGSDSTPNRGSVYFGLMPNFVSGSSPVSRFMQDKYKILAYVNYEATFPAPDSCIDLAYSSFNYTANSTVSSDTWQHVALSYTGDGSTNQEDRWNIYVDGLKISLEYHMDPHPLGGIIPKGRWRNPPLSGACSIGIAKKDNYPLEESFTGNRLDPAITGWPTTSGSFFHIFNGLLDEATIWKENLSDSQISELYNNGYAQDLEKVSFSTSSLVSWYRFGDLPLDTPGPLPAGIVTDSGPFGATAGNMTDLAFGTEASASIGVDSGSVVFSTSEPLLGELADLRSSPLYNRKQTLKSIYSVVDRHGVAIPEAAPAIQTLTDRWGTTSPTSSVHPYLDEAPLGSIEPYGGSALWEADRLAGSGNPFVSSSRSPFYDSYGDYAVDTKSIFKAGTILPEFRISEKIKEYAENEDFLVKSSDNFSIFGIPSDNPDAPQNSSENNFNKFYTNSEFMQFFDIVKSDHEGVAAPDEITINCRGLKKFIPYDGFYPSERTLQIVSQFSKSYSEFLEPIGGYDSGLLAAKTRPIMAAMFSPGILYNSIKAGMAVDYPVALDFVSKFEYASFISGSTELTSSGYWSLGTGSSGLSGWDYRVPFEALLEPEEFLRDKNVTDMEPDPSCSLGLTARLGQSGDDLYKMMINNFLAEIPEFFLKNEEFTAIRSIPDNSKDFGKVSAGQTYGMRVKMRRSMNKTRRWYHPSFAANQDAGFEMISDYQLPQDPLYQPDLRETFTMYSRPTAFGPPVAGANKLFDATTGSAPNPMDVRISYAGVTMSSGIKHTFIGPAGANNQDLYPSDSLNGYNPSFTPPYYNGEAWADILYTAPQNITGNVSLDDILNNSKIIYWRIDGSPILRTRYKGKPGTTGHLDWFFDTSASLDIPMLQMPAIWAPATSSTLASSSFFGDYDYTGLSSYESGDDGTGWHFWASPSTWNGSGPNPMSPRYANKFAMQLSASINLLGREDVLTQDFDPEGNPSQKSTAKLSGRWVIQPKFETPMFNFGDRSIRPITSASNTLTIPTHGSESVPRGMWHQYGCLPRTNEGIFLEISDIPENWVKYRGAYSGSERVQTTLTEAGFLSYPVGNFQSENYDDYGAGSPVHSLMDVAGFTQVGAGKADPGKRKSISSQKRVSKKLGQLKEGKEVSEAIVAIPFYLEDGNQKLFSLEKEKIQAILNQQRGISSISPDDDIGVSLIEMVSKMQKFVIPPRYDFVNYPEVLKDDEIGPFAIYLFDFNHTFTSEDLSHIWQNTMPNAGTKSVFGEPAVESSITHALTKGELLDAEDFEKEIYWMVFKAKQRAAKDYFEKTTANKLRASSLTYRNPTAPSYNWPYDFFSLIELGNMETEVTLRKSSDTQKKQTELLAADPNFKFPEFNYNEKK